MLSLILSLRKEVVPYFASARYGTGACSWQCSVVKPNNLILSDLIWLWARLPCVWAPTHAGRVDGRPPRRLRAAKEIRGAHHLQLLGSSGGRFTVDELGQRASFIGAQRGPACLRRGERAWKWHGECGCARRGCGEAGTACSPQSVGSRCLGGYPPHAVGDRVLGARGAAALSAATRLRRAVPRPATGAHAARRGDSRLPHNLRLTNLFRNISSKRPRGDAAFSDSLYAWKIVKFGYYSGPTPLRATPLPRTGLSQSQHP